MPYVIVKVSDNPKLYKVKKDQRGRPKYFSKDGLPLKQAIKQMQAIIINQHHQ